ncbi:hypothetical protein EW026_g979 [Hermanssonia centrifuga]|uniref:Vacuolar protein sorting-associated protein 13 n=1 Tax=Hermanssonia centrifuga TaxID=98765 RepID=A0A4S4KT76_9APHY|nr:hypothetical protein EW026_g979 [Hermanssonia centrifuga]
MNQVNYGIGQGQLTLRGLRLKRGALDKFRLPVDVIEGHLGRFTLSLHWMNLGNQPVEILIEDVYLLVVPSSETSYDPEEEERRSQAAKAERLQNAELLHMEGQVEQGQDAPQQQGLISSLIAKVINNLQVTVKNVHIRYEDKFSVPGHPFSAGITLAGFTAASVNDSWVPAFIDSTAGVIHKLAKLESLAVYFDTDARSLAGLSHQDFVEKFTDLISHGSHLPDHQFILKPVTGEGRVKMNNKSNKDTPKFDVQLLFDEIGVLLDDNQYRDVISLIDMYHFYIRQHQYRKYRPSQPELGHDKPKALMKFAVTAVLDEVRERRRKWTWAYFAERRDDRHRYVDLFKKKQLGPLAPADTDMLDALERKLSYEDLRFYRSIARSQLKKDLAVRKKLEYEKKAQQQTQARSGWTGWLWGSSGSQSTSTTEEPAFTGEMTDEQRKQLYEILDYDEKAALAASFETPRDALKARVHAKLERGSFALKSDPHGKSTEIISVVFDRFHASFLQRPDNFESSLSLTGFTVHDGTTENTLYPLIVQVQDSQEVASPQNIEFEPQDPFFFLKFEHNPLDQRADNALTMRMRNMEIIYHKEYIEAIYRFFKPPSSQLESVEALLNVAGQTLEGIRKETRAGLEYALQTHKTVDIQMDINAPVIIIPEDVTVERCSYLVIDAGHIAIESELADKKAVQEINAKRKRQYSDDDYQRLESMMYDKLSVRLEDAQFVVGNDLQLCREALKSQQHGNLHLLERISIDLQVQNSIIPTAYNLARFKISGHLPSLQINLSDTKYKSLMRLVDVAIPHFDDDDDDGADASRPALERGKSSGFGLRSGFFGQTDDEYHVDDVDDEGQVAHTHDDGDDPEEFFEAHEGDDGQLPQITQHIAEVDFRVDTLRASLYKSSDGNERELGTVCLQQFFLAFALAKYTMTVDVKLRSLSMDVQSSPGEKPIHFISSREATASEDLLTIKYTRVQPESPQFMTLYEGINQNVDIKVTTVVVRAAPEPVVTLYDFIMSTFVPNSNASIRATVPSESAEGKNLVLTEDTVQQPEAKIQVVVKLAGVQTILMNEDIRIATLSMSTADVHILLRPNTMRISGRLANLALSDDSDLQTTLPEFKQILSIEGDNVANFQYLTYDPKDVDNSAGIKSSMYLAAGSLRLNYLEESLHQIYIFLAKLAKLKGLYDAATQAAAQSVSDIDRMQFEVSIKSPIVVFPTDVERSSDVLTLRLGEFNARNSYEGLANTINAGLKGVSLSSTVSYDGKPSILKMIDDIDASASILQTSGIDRTHEFDKPDTQISVTISDVKLHLTQLQFRRLIALSQSIPRVLTGPKDTSSAQNIPSSNEQLIEPASSETTIDLQPELREMSGSDHPKTWTSVDLFVTLDVVKLHLYDSLASTEQNLRDHGIARFALNSSTLRAKMLQDGALEAEVVLKSFTMSNTRPGNSKFREIIPAAHHTRNQVMVLYTMSSGADKSAMAVVTVDSPQIIFAIEPIMALLEFFTSSTNEDRQIEDAVPNVQSDETASSPQSSTLNVRFDLHDVSVSVLENDSDVESRAIRLSIKQIFLSQQGILALSVERLGMSLTRMGKSAETVRFLDDVDLTLSLDSRSSASHRVTNMQLTSKAIVFRASYRDINLITTIVNKAIALYSASTETHGSTSDGKVTQFVKDGRASGRPTRTLGPSSQPVGNAKVVLSKEQFQGSCDGFRLVLIGDLHEQPLLHLKVKPFILGAKDWSGELQATTTLAVYASYWNLTNSHWEPLFDPWTFTALVNERKYAHCTAFIELAIATANMLGKEGERMLRKARGSYAPYKIRNRTGCSVCVWSDVDGSTDISDVTMTEIANEKSIDWRFDDWKTMREHVSSTAHNSIGLQFIGKQWDQVRSIPVDREGEYTFSLRPKTERYAYRVLCEVIVQDNVKVVTLRSTFKVENQTLYPLEIMLVDEGGQPVRSLEKIAPGQDYPLPIEGIGSNRIKVQPDQGFGYKWSPSIRWEDLVTRRSFTIRCPHSDQNEAPFRFQAFADTNANDVNAKKYPKITLKLRAPIELENLLPYNIDYRIYDKDADQNWRSYLRKGGVMPVHSVELGHMVLLNVHVQETVFKPSDFSIINTDGSADFDVETRLTLHDAKDRKLDLRLNYVRYPNSGGAFKVQVYCPYLIVNKTGLPFSVRPWRTNRLGSSQDVAGDTTIGLYFEAPSVTRKVLTIDHWLRIIITPSAVHDQGNNFSFKVGESLWSQAIGFEAPSADSLLSIPSQSRANEEINVGVSWSEGLGKYKLTKVVTLAPRFIIRNDTLEVISFREHAVAPRGRATLSPGERCPLQFMRAGEEKLLTLAFSGLNAQWSAPINVEDIGSVHLRLKRTNDSSEVHLICADVKLAGSTIFIVISRAEESWPYAIENDSDYSFTFYQSDWDHPDTADSGRTVPTYRVANKSRTDYAWDYPASRGKKLILSINGSRRAIDVMEIGDLVPFKFVSPQGSRTVSLDVRAESRMQVIRITNYNPQLSLYKPTRRNTLSIAQQDSMSGSQEAFEAIQEEIPPTFTLKIDFAGLGLSLINRKTVEVVYFSIDALKFDYTDSPVAQAVNLACGSIQMDNQLHDALFPVVLQPTPIPKDSSTVASLPTVQGSVIWLKDQEHGVTFVKYCSILLQALTVQADEDFLYTLYDLTKLKGASWDSAQEDILILQPENIPEPEATASGEELYFEVLELQPIKLSISFMRTERVSSEEQLSIRNPFAVVINAITMAVGNINAAPLEMNALAIKDMRLKLPDLQDRILYHYRQEVLRQLYRILGSADFIGNPVGLFTNVSSGVADIFYEPFNGVVMHGNQELGIGIAKGAASFVKKTLFGVSDSVTKFTSSVGKGLSAATFDSEYQMRRRMTQRRNRPRHAIYGVTAGAEAFANSVASGVEGVVLKPIEGAESDGAMGFFKGIGKGLVGVVTKPVIGVFDLASNLSEGIRNTTTVFDNPARDRVRLVRSPVQLFFSQRK